MQLPQINIQNSGLKIGSSKLTRHFFLFTVFLSVFIKSLIVLGYVHKINFSNKLLIAGGILVYSAFILVLLSLSFLFKGRGSILFLIVLDLLISILFIMDIWYFRGYGNLASVHLLKETANLENLSDSLFSMGRLKDVALLLDILPFSFLALYFGKTIKDIKRNIKLFLLFFLSSAIYITSVSLIIDVKKAIPNQTFFYTSWVPTRTVSQLSPLGYHYLDLFLFVVDSHHISLSKKQKTEISNWFKDKQENIPDNSYKGIFKGKNLLFLQVESLENFVINKQINGQEITPNLNKLIKNSIYFSSFYEQINNGGSTDADLMANTSIYPLRVGSTFFRYPDNKYNSLPNLMEEAGYSTIAIHPDRGAYWNWMQSLKAIGFNKLIDSEYFKKDEEIGLGLSDGSFLRQVEPLLMQQKQPFYSFVVTLTSHSPFNLPNKYRELVISNQLNKTKLGGYFQSVHYTDKQIGLLVSRLESDGLLDNTVIVIYGDHCGVHRYYKDELADIKPWEDWWLKANEQIPFIIYQKGLKPEARNTIGGQIDIMPTIAYLMGIDEAKLVYSAMGRNLFKTNKNFAITAHGDFIGDSQDSLEVQYAAEGLKIADLIIQSDYFKVK